jgi:CBS domain-containing protein
VVKKDHPHRGVAGSVAACRLTGGLMNARDLMVPLREYLKPDNTIKEAVNLLRKAHRSGEKLGVKGLPILDERGHLAGILSMRDIIKAIFPIYTSLMRNEKMTWQEVVEVGAARVSEKKVVMYMARDVISVRDDTPLAECIDYMVKKGMNRLPISDKTGSVVGMLYERDVFFEIVKVMVDEESEADQSP